MQAQLVIPSTTGANACTDGGMSQLNPGAFFVPASIANSLTLNLPSFTAAQFTAFFGTAVPPEGIPLSIGVMKNESGGSAAAETQSLGTITSSTPSMAQTVTFSLDKSTRYVVGLIREDSFITRRCFKTRGEFSTAEQNLVFDDKENEWKPNLARYNRTGCYAVASTRQDIRDCYCNGTRNGTHILAGQTAASQAQRQYLNCPDLDS